MALHNPLPYCAECQRQFVHQAALVQHRSTKHTPDFSCQQCDLKFYDEQSLDGHLHVVHSPEHNCDEYPQQFVERTALEQHRSSVHALKPHCEKCILDFDDKLSFDKHRAHECPLRYLCNLCEGHFGSFDLREQHRSLVHAPPLKPRCRRCSLDFPDKGSLDHHLRSIHPFIHRALEQHRSRSQQTLGQHQESFMHITQFFCAECNKCFLDENSRDEHSSVHVRPPHCEKCKKYSPDQYALDQHLVSPAHSTIFYCNECHRGFPSYESLVKHYVLVHTSQVI